MFLHSVANQNPKLYFELYEEPDVPEEWERSSVTGGLAED
jgi:hypothetical protein